MRVRLLGPVDVVVGGVQRPVNGLRRKAVLAALALRPGEPVSTDRLVDIVWGDSPPATAASTLQSHVSDLRRVLADRAAILARPPGYLLNVGNEATDLAEAQRLVLAAAGAADLPSREAQLHAAVGLWRGQPLADLTGLAWFGEQARRLDDLLLHARHALIDTRMSLGEHARLVPELEVLCRQYPLDEQVHGWLMLALYRSGRQADALSVYQQLRHMLDEDLGIEPGHPLRDLNIAILRQDPSLDAPQRMTLDSAGPASVAAAGTTPMQLPLPISTFAGRTRELARLDALIPAADRQDSSSAAPVVVSAVSGTAGVGKTVLAVHWAHRIATRFPDGQLYVNLRGFDGGGALVDPAEALRGFLEAFKVPPEQIPNDLPVLVGLYRSHLAGKRVLVLLDNARDAEQVRPLLPASSGCLAIVTSRNLLTPLVVSEGAHPVLLDVLSADEAHGLLSHRLGADRIARDPDATDDVVARCAGLPLALAIAAARAAIHPAFPLSRVAAELRDASRRLDALTGSARDTDVRAVFSWSYRGLSDGAAGLFRLLGLHAGPDITEAAAASLAGVPPRAARALIAELTDASLITEHTPGRYGFHDLMRAYATEQAHTLDDDAHRHAALQRVLDHYLHTAHAATLLLNPMQEPIDLAAPHPGVTPEDITCHDEALAWFTAEQAVLITAVERAPRAGFDVHTWQLAWSLREFLGRWARWREQVPLHHIALAAARRLDDRRAEAQTLRGLGRAYVLSGQNDEAEIHCRHALRLSTELDDIVGIGHTYRGLITVSEHRGDLRAGLGFTERAMESFRLAGNTTLEACALSSIGWFHARLGDHRRALTYCEPALALLQDAGHRLAEAGTWDSLGYAHRGLGHYQESATCYRHALDLYRRLGEHYMEADTLASLGDTHHGAGDHDAAREVWQEAMKILAELGHPDTDKVTAKLCG